jgi:hypothetical protein
MWRISYKTMSLQEVLIMAYMNVLQAKVSSSFPGHNKAPLDSAFS